MSTSSLGVSSSFLPSLPTPPTIRLPSNFFFFPPLRYPSASVKSPSLSAEPPPISQLFPPSLPLSPALFFQFVSILSALLDRTFPSLYLSLLPALFCCRQTLSGSYLYLSATIVPSPARGLVGPAPASLVVSCASSRLLLREEPVYMGHMRRCWSDHFPKTLTVLCFGLIPLFTSLQSLLPAPPSGPVTPSRALSHPSPALSFSLPVFSLGLSGVYVVPRGEEQHSSSSNIKTH